jgi:hypothetical protein
VQKPLFHFYYRPIKCCILCFGPKFVMILTFISDFVEWLDCSSPRIRDSKYAINYETWALSSSYLSYTFFIYYETSRISCCCCYSFCVSKVQGIFGNDGVVTDNWNRQDFLGSCTSILLFIYYSDDFWLDVVFLLFIVANRK